MWIQPKTVSLFQVGDVVRFGHKFNQPLDSSTWVVICWNIRISTICTGRKSNSTKLCPLVGSGILDTWIILKAFLCFVLDSQGTYIYISLYIYIYIYISIYTTTIFIYHTMTHPWSFFSYWAVAKVELLDEEEAEQAKLSRLDAISCFYPKFLLGFMWNCGPSK